MDLVHWEDLEGLGGERGERGDWDGNTCKSMADSFQCMTKPTTIKKKTKKKKNAKECSNYHTVALISHAGKIVHKILQDRLQ